MFKKILIAILFLGVKFNSYAYDTTFVDISSDVFIGPQTVFSHFWPFKIGPYNTKPTNYQHI